MPADNRKAIAEPDGVVAKLSQALKAPGAADKGSLQHNWGKGADVLEEQAARIFEVFE